MGMQFQQTDDAGLSPGAYCSPSGTDLGVQTMSRHCAVDGDPGDSPGTGSTRTTNNQTAERALYFSFTPGVENWAGGTYKVRLNNRTTSNFVTISRVDICRVNSGGASVASIGSESDLDISLTSTGVKTIDVEGGAQPSASDTDQVIVVVSFASSGTGSWVVVGWDADQIIDTPIDDGDAAPSSTSDGPSITLSIAGAVVKRAASAASLDLNLDADGDGGKSGQAEATLGLDLGISATGEASEDGPTSAEIPLQLGIAGTVTKRVSVSAALSLALDLASRPLVGPAYSFFPPTVMEAPIARAPDRRLQKFFDRLRLERGVSVVRDGAGWKEVRYVVPEVGWVEGEDYFVGGHHYVIPRELAAELIDAGYQPELIEETP